MPDILAIVISDMIVAGPLVCGLFAAWAASKIFHDSLATCIGIGVIAAIVVGFVIRPLHKENNPHRYAPVREPGSYPGGINYRGE